MCFLQRLLFKSAPSRPKTGETSKVRDADVIIGDTVLFKYKVTHHIATGGRTDVFGGIDIEDGKKVAIKVSNRRQTGEVRANLMILDSYPSPEGFPQILGYGYSSSQSFIVLQHLGLSLSDYLFIQGGRFEVKTVCMIAMQAITRLAQIHNKGVIHGDVKPENFAMGRGEQDGTLNLIDFKAARRLRDHQGMHVPHTIGNRLRGSFCYASLNAHAGIQVSRRDDLISLGYMLVRLMKGVLPWERTAGVLMERNEVIRVKEIVRRSELCKGLPVQFNVYFKYVLGLAFSEMPEYDGLVWLFRNCLDRSDAVFDGRFEWMDHPDYEKFQTMYE